MLLGPVEDSVPSAIDLLLLNCSLQYFLTECLIYRCGYISNIGIPGRTPHTDTQTHTHTHTHTHTYTYKDFFQNFIPGQY